MGKMQKMMINHKYHGYLRLLNEERYINSDFSHLPEQLFSQPDIFAECDPSMILPLTGRTNAIRKIPSSTVEAPVHVDAERVKRIKLFLLM
jgi:hypothetical protein